MRRELPDPAPNARSRYRSGAGQVIHHARVLAAQHLGVTHPESSQRCGSVGGSEHFCQLLGLREAGEALGFAGL